MNKFNELYPEIPKNGSVANALQLSFQSIGSALEVTGKSMARVEKNRRSSQVSTALEERSFGIDYWDRGVMLASACTLDFLEVTRSIQTWVEEMASTAQLKESFHFVTLKPISEAFENDREVEWQWTQIEERTRKEEHLSSLHPLVIAARQSNELKQLFPYTSMFNLGFSRCTGYPFSYDCPSVASLSEGQFQVRDASNKIVGKGDIEWAVQCLINHLPPNCGPASKGTADDL